MSSPAATTVQVIGGLLAMATVTPVVMGLGAVTPWLILVFVLGVVLLYVGARMRRTDRAAEATRNSISGAPSPEREATDEDLDRAGINRAPDGTPTSPGVDEQSGIKGM